MQGAPDVLIVPGLHPRGCEALQNFTYSSAIPLWEADGFNVSVQQFGWNDRRSLSDRQKSLLETVDALPHGSYGIGASAGALALIAAFKERPDKFHRLVTVAAPLSLTEEILPVSSGIRSYQFQPYSERHITRQMIS
jgi:hypothetical protein